MRLALDLGNTRLKWSPVAGSGGLGETRALAWSENLGDVLRQAWLPLPRPQQVWAASVVDEEHEAQLAAAVRAVFDQPVQWVRTQAHACGVRVAYEQPRDLGVDRFLGMIAALADGLAPCVLVSCGTALVLDAVHADGRHAGGLIAPGPALMQQSVLGATARVRPATPGRLMEAAASTADALSSGCWLAGAALVERFARHMHGVLGVPPTLLLSGGDGATLLSLLERPAICYPDPVLRGLAVWMQASSADRQPTTQT